MASKLRFSNKADIIDLPAGSTTNPYTSDAISFRTEQIGATIYTLATVAGSLQLQVYMGGKAGEAGNDPNTMLESDWQNLGTARTITANTLDQTTINGGLPPMRAVFTPNATPYACQCRVWGFGG